RFLWDLRYAPSTKLEGKDPAFEPDLVGPMVAPGTYQVTLEVGEQSLTQSFEIVKEPRIATSQEDLQAQFDLLMRIHEKIDATIKDVNAMRDLRLQLDGWS